jgi:DNA-binding CsgD family transcriptional regulator
VEQRRDVSDEVIKAAAAAESSNRDVTATARRIEAVSLRMAGLSIEQIAERLKVSENAATAIIKRATDRVEADQVKSMRELENQRLDRLQMALWSEGIKGDVKAISMILKISDQRAKLNGLYSPTQIQMTMSIRTEMEQALGELEALVLNDDYAEEVTGDDDDQPGPPGDAPVRELRPYEIPDSAPEGADS